MPRLRSSVWTAAAILALCSGCYSPMFQGGYRGYGAPYQNYGVPYGYPVGGPGIQTLPPGTEYVPGTGVNPTFAPGTNQLSPIPEGATGGGNTDAPPYYPEAAPGSRPVPPPEGNEDLQQPIDGGQLKESNAGASLERPSGWDSEPVEQTAAADSETSTPRRLDRIDTDNALPMGEPELTAGPADAVPADELPASEAEESAELFEPTGEVPLSAP